MLPGGRKSSIIKYRCLGGRKACLPKAPPVKTGPSRCLGEVSVPLSGRHFKGYIFGPTTTATTVRVPRRVSTRSCNYCNLPFIQDRFFTLASSQLRGTLSPFTIVGVNRAGRLQQGDSQRLIQIEITENHEQRILNSELILDISTVQEEITAAIKYAVAGASLIIYL